MEPLFLSRAEAIKVLGLGEKCFYKLVELGIVKQKQVKGLFLEGNPNPVFCPDQLREAKQKIEQKLQRNSNQNEIVQQNFRR